MPMTSATSASLTSRWTTSAPHQRATPVTRTRRFLEGMSKIQSNQRGQQARLLTYFASRLGSAEPANHLASSLSRGQEKLFGNPNRGNGRRRVSEADPPMRENRQVFPHIYVLLITSRSICATARATTSRRGDFAWRSANSSWRSSEYRLFIALIASPMSTFEGRGIWSSGSPADHRYAKSM